MAIRLKRQIKEDQASPGLSVSDNRLKLTIQQLSKKVKDITRELLESKRRVRRLETEKQMLQTENQRLKHQLNTITTRKGRQSDEFGDFQGGGGRR